MVTVGTLAYNIVANFGGLTAGVGGSRAELKTLKEAFLATQTPTERFSMAIEHLEKQATRFPEKAAVFNKAIASMRAEIEKLNAPPAIAPTPAPVFQGALGRGSTFAMGQDLQAAAEASFRQRAGFMDRVRASSARLEQTENLRIMREQRQAFIDAQTPLASKGSLLEVKSRRLQMVVDPLSLSLQGLRAASDLAGVGLQKLEQLVGAIADRMQRLDDITKQAKALGIAESSLIGFTAAAQDLAGVDASAFEASFTIFTRRIADAAMSGKGEAFSAFKRLGLDVQELSRMRPDQALLRTAEAMERHQNPAERLSLAYDLLGKAGANLAPMLAAGSEEIKRITDRANELQQTRFIDFRDIEEANDALGRMKMMFDGILGVAGSEFAPLIKDITDDMTEGFGKATDKGQGLRDLIKEIAAAVATVSDAFENLGKTTNSLPGGSSGLLKMLGNATGTRGGFQAFDIFSKIEAGVPGSRTANIRDSQMAAPLPIHEEFRKAKEDLEVIKRTKEAQAEAEHRSGKLSVGKPPGVEALEMIQKANKMGQENEERRDKSRMDALQRRIDKEREFIKETRTDVEKSLARFAEIEGAGLDPETRRRALDDLREDVEKQAGLGVVPRSIEAVRAGSVEALRAEFGPKMKNDETLVEAKKAAVQRDQANDLLTRIVTAMEEQPQQVVHD